MTMSMYNSWNDFFSNNKNTYADSINKNIDEFESCYKERYGTWLDYDYLNFTKKYGDEKANKIIKKRVNALDKENEKEKSKEYDWQPVPKNAFIPF